VNTTAAVNLFHARYPKKPGPMPEGSEVEELQRRGLNVSGFAGAQHGEGGYCHGLPRNHSRSLDPVKCVPAKPIPDPRPSSPPEPASLPDLPIVEIGSKELTLEARSVQDLQALSDSQQLWDVRDEFTRREATRNDGGERRTRKGGELEFG
jgi:hypothetical protein